MTLVLRVGLLGLVVALLAAQLIPVERTNPPVVADVQAPLAIAAYLRRACYDCHSNETVWPWYAHLAPASWLVAHDVAEGREHLNFSVFGTLGARQRARLLGKVIEDVEEGEMPPLVYTLAHRAARLDAEARAALIAWARAEVAGVTPARSPVVARTAR